MSSLCANTTPSPRVRGLVAATAIAGALVATSPALLAIGLVAVIIPLLAVLGLASRFARFAGIVILPIAAGLLFVWGWLVGAPPGEAYGSAPTAGCLYAIAVALRLALVSGVVYVCVLSEPPDRMVALFQSWGARNEFLTLLIVSLALWPEFLLRTEQIAAARCARGLMPNRTLWTRAQQFPFVLRTLFTWAIGNALARMELWRQQNLLRLLEQRASATANNSAGTLIGNLLFSLCAVVWLGCAIYTRLQQ
jgi:hypothetical protein